jgi:hypothetical protein
MPKKIPKLKPLTAVNAQQMYRDLSRHVTIDTCKEILHTMNQTVTEDSAMILYLGHLCACGYIYEVYKELERIENKELLNTPHTFFTQGTLLHWALYWNTGNKGRMLYDLLIQFGAVHKMNYLNEYAFEQDGNKWICLLDMGTFAQRNPLEFRPLYNEIADKTDTIE